MKAMLWLTCLVLGVAFSASCGGGNTSAPEKDWKQHHIVQWQEIEALLPYASITQQEILADGIVTPGETERAASEVVECAAKQDVAVNHLSDGYRHKGFHTFTPKGADRNHSTAVFEACTEELFDLVEWSLALQNSLSSEEQDRLNQLVIECLASAGYDVDDVGSWPNPRFEPDPSVVADCYDAAEDELDLFGW